MRRTPGFGTGLVVGLALTAALLAVLYFARAAFRLPFAPDAVFERVTRLLPGAVVTAGIDAMVAVIRALSLGPTSTAAKAAEQGLAVLGLLAAGTLAAGVVFAVTRGRRTTLLPGLVAGAIVGVPAALATGTLAGAAWTAAAFLAWGAAVGTCRRRLTDTEDLVEPADRRRFLVRLGAATASITVIGAGAGVWLARRRRPSATGRPWSATNALPNAGDPLRPAPGTRAELTPVERHYRIDIDTEPPDVDASTWRLRIFGLVQRPTELTLADLRTRYPPLDQFVTLECISNPVGGDLISTQRWTGAPLARVLDDVGLLPGATHLRLRAADDYDEVVEIALARSDERVMLTYAWDGLPLPRSHGFPLRIYIPDRYGMKQPKWIVSIEAIDHPAPGYWVRRGWDAQAIMKATAVIDAVASSMDIGPGTTVPIGGIAFAGARGVSRVAVQVDGGAWVDARLRAPLAPTTWVVWRFDWPFQAGEHTFVVRCWDGNGVPQIAERGSIRPSGATGLHSRKMMF